MIRVAFKSAIVTNLISFALPLLLSAADVLAAMSDIFGVTQESSEISAAQPQEQPAAYAPQVKIPVEIELSKEAAVTGNRFFLSEIAVCKGDDADCKELLSLDLGKSPEVGGFSLVSKKMVEEAIKKSSSLRDYSFKGADYVRITSKFQDLKESDLKEALRNEILKANASADHLSYIIEMDKIYLSGRPKVRAGEYQFVLNDLSRKVESVNELVEEYFKNNGLKTKVIIKSLSGQWPDVEMEVRIKLKVSAQLPVATRMIKKGELLDAKAVAFAYREVRSLVEISWSDMKEIEGSIAKQLIRTGEIIKSARIERTKLVKRGESVQIKILSGGIEFTGFGVSLGNGASGETVMVLLGKDKKKLSGKVLGQSLVEVLM
jgi:flagella basal body P-ring formation protein FlgA